MNNDYIERNISANIKKYRNKKHMTQLEVAEALHVHPTTVQKWERGVNRIYPRELASLCKLFDVKIGDMIGDMMGDTNNDRLTFAEYKDWLHRTTENDIDIYTKNLNKENDRKQAKAGDTYIDITEKVIEYPQELGFSLSICYEEFIWVDRGAYIEPCIKSKINLLFYDYEDFFSYSEIPNYEDKTKQFEEFRIQKENVYENIIEKVKKDILTENDMKDYDLEYVQAFNIIKNNKPLFIYYNYDFFNIGQEPIRKYVLNITDKTIDIDELLQDIHSINYGRFLGECIKLFENMYPDIAEIIVGEHCKNIHKYGDYWPNVECANGFLYNGVLTALFNDSSNCRVINDTAYYILDHIKSSKHCDCSILLDVCQNKYLCEETIQHLFNYIFGEKKKNITELKKGFAWAFALNPFVSSEMLSEIYKNMPKKVFSLDSYKDLYYLQLRMAIFENRNCPHNLRKQLIYEINKIKNHHHYSKHLQWFDFCNKPTQEALMEANEKLQIDYRMIADEIFERYDDYLE